MYICMYFLFILPKVKKSKITAKCYEKEQKKRHSSCFRECPSPVYTVTVSYFSIYMNQVPEKLC